MRLRMPLTLVLSLSACGVNAPAQDYILRPGPRGFDARLNRYGATEQGQPAPSIGEERFNPTRTTLRIELLLPPDGSALDAQTWSRALADAGYQARIRQGLSSDKPEVSESTRGPLRLVTVIGALDRRGNVSFPARTFGPGQVGELKDWLNELKSYGAQGSPEGQPLWGLTRAQFDVVYAALATPIDADVTGLPPAAAIAELRLSKQHPLRFSAAAKRALDESASAGGVSRSLPGITTGTALAFVLNEFDLGFRPERTPSGAIELLVEPLPNAAQETRTVVWPVGWRIEEAPSPERGAPPVKDKDALPPNRVLAAPTLFEMKQLGFPLTPLSKALTTVEQESGVPVLLDRPALAAAAVDISRPVTLPTRRTSWSLALRLITAPQRLRHELRRDERGQPIIWVTSLKSHR